jgi:protein-tyrosine phosphatase
VTAGALIDCPLNLRDLGGKPTRHARRVRAGLVYRAASLHHVNGRSSIPGIDRLVTVIDLRSPIEIERAGACRRVRPTRVMTAPMLTELWGTGDYDPTTELAPFLAERYLDMLQVGRLAIASSLEILADPASLPAVFFCAAGKDRTGVLAAVLLSLLDVADEEIAADYAMSVQPVRALSEWMRATSAVGPSGLLARDSRLLAAPEEAMLLFLRRMRAIYGSPQTYASSIGVPARTLSSLRRQLTG